MLNSYSRSSSQVNKELSYSKSTNSVLHPKITLLTPRPRCNFQLSSNGTPSSLKINTDGPEPMLTSTSYNANVSSYIRSKSPGYTGTLVQYNGDSSRDQQLTHQEKYGSPELFPGVHLFQKEISIIKPKQKTLRIGTSDIEDEYSQNHRLILKGIVRTNSVTKKNSRSGNDLSPRSLGVHIEPDVLKEIPRKRTHDTEEYERDDSNKKLRGNCMANVDCDGDSSKRTREVESTKSDACTSQVTKPAMEMLCTIDAVLASRTSSMFINYDISDKRKMVEDRKDEVSPTKKKKFNDADTQTENAFPLETISVSTESNENTQEQIEAVEQTQMENVEESPSPPKHVVKIFDDKRLEINRKNRLRFLLSAMTGQKIPSIPIEDRRKALDQDWRPKKR